MKKPRNFDNNLLVIGGGAAGLVSSLIAATVRAKVTLVEREAMGGDCLNTGCVPSKALIRSARVAKYLSQAQRYGLQANGEVDFAAVMDRVQSVIKAIEPHDSVERYTELGVNCMSGNARLISPWEVDIDGQIHSAKNIVIASGAQPKVVPIPGLEQTDYLTSDTLWGLRELPRHLVVIGGGPIGCELAQAFRRLGAKVSIVEVFKMMPREDEDVRAEVQAQLKADGIDIYEGVVVEGFTGPQRLRIVDEGKPTDLDFDQVLLATGREARVKGMGLEALGIEVTAQGTIAVDKYLRTAQKNIYACGDVVGPYQFTHVASHQAWYAAVNSLFGSPLKRFAVDYSVIPWATYTDPEVARVGLNEMDAQAQGIAYEVTKYGIDDLDRAICDGEAHGFVKVLTPPGKDKILGVTIVGYHASELLQEFVLAMRHGLGLNKILGTIHPYPTLNEANKYAAGEWKKARKPEGLLNVIERFHSWRR